MAILKILLSFVMGVVGTWMLWRGRKLMNVKMMVWGAILIVLSYFAFSGGGDDKAVTKAMINAINPSAPAVQTPQP